MDKNDFDNLLARVEVDLIRAGDGLLTFWDPKRKNFIRETVELDERGKLSVGRTSTSRAITALIEFERFLAERPDLRSEIARLRPVLQAAIKYQIDPMKDPNELTRIRDSSVNMQNMFTDAHLLHAAAYAARWTDSADSGRLRRTLVRVQRANAHLLKKHLGGRVHERDDVHDFITLHIVMALDTFQTWSAKTNGTQLFNLDVQTWQWEERLIERVRRSIVDQLGHERAGVSSFFDPGELAFSTVLLDRFGSASEKQIIDEALRVIAAHQSPDGAWPTSRVVSYGGKRLLHVASSEIALALTSVARRALLNQDIARVHLLLPILEKALHLVHTTFHSVVVDGYPVFKGWCNDRERWSNLVESWATAIVVSLLVRLRNLFLECRQHFILSEYTVGYPTLQRIAWPHLSDVLLQRSICRKDLERVSDPTDGGQLVNRLSERVLQPVAGSPIGRPKKDCVSFLVPGPPGSRKTSLVRCAATALRWPFVTLSPPDFLRGGMDGFERTASSIFADLQRLRRVVVLFDECEDFIKQRAGTTDNPTARTIGAFITSGMLPRLQALHDNQWILFAMATNSLPEHLDEAATRPGRFDFTIDMHYPKELAQARYLKKKLEGKDSEKHVHAVVEKLRLLTTTTSAGGDAGVPWGVLDAIATRFRDERTVGKRKLHRIVTTAWESAKSGGPPNLH